MFDIDFQLSDSFFRTREALYIIQNKGLPNLTEGVIKAQELIQEEWRKRSAVTFKFSSGNYLQNIRQLPIEENSNDIIGKVINSLPYARVLEKGMTSEERMRILHTSHQVRINKEGGKYLIIPFRHGSSEAKTMNPMPKSVYAQAKKLVNSTRTGSYWELSQQLGQPHKKVKSSEPRAIGKSGEPLAQRFSYKYGERLTGVGGIWEGMYKFGSSGHTQYISFRVMSEHGKAWKGIPAMRIAEKTAAYVKPQVMAIMKTALKQDKLDINQMIGGGIA